MNMEEWWDSLTVDERLELLKKWGINTEFAHISWAELSQFQRNSISILSLDLKR